MANTNQFLLKEYEMCFEQLRFYDSRSNDLLKYLFTLTSSVATAQFAIYKLNQSFDDHFFLLQTFLSVVVFIASLLLFMAMLQNRLYFTYMARQINAIRGYLLLFDSPEFKNNQLYTSTTFSALKPSSVHTFQLIGAAMLCGLYAASFTYGVFNIAQQSKVASLWAFLTFLLVSLVTSIGGAIYLAKTGSKTADNAIHREKA
jgi:hypothetical protein